jgi:hypothetical protein
MSGERALCARAGELGCGCQAARATIGRIFRPENPHEPERIELPNEPNGGADQANARRTEGRTNPSVCMPKEPELERKPIEPEAGDNRTNLRAVEHRTNPRDRIFSTT